MTSRPERTATPATRASPGDLQEHLARLEERGLITRIDRRIDEDTELHPLVRWRFQGGLAEHQRRERSWSCRASRRSRRSGLKPETPLRDVEG